jgi:hypothetical protein
VWLFRTAESLSYDFRTILHFADVAHHLVDESDFNFVTMPLLKYFSDNICQLGNLLNVSSELTENVMMDLEQVYRQSNIYEASFQIF